MKSTELDIEASDDSDVSLRNARIAERFSLSDEQTLDLILSIVAAVQAGIDGNPELQDELLRDTEQRFAYPRLAMKAA